MNKSVSGLKNKFSNSLSSSNKSFSSSSNSLHEWDKFSLFYLLVLLML